MESLHGNKNLAETLAKKDQQIKKNQGKNKAGKENCN